MSRFLEKPSLTKLSTELLKVNRRMADLNLAKTNICQIIKKMFDQVSEWTFIEIGLPTAPQGKRGKTIPTMVKTLNPEAEAIIQMGLDAGCDWAKQKAQQHGLSY